MRNFRTDATFASELTPFAAEFLDQRNDAPLDLEVGCGVGWHPIRYARDHADRKLIAIEKTTEKFEKFSGRLSRHCEKGENFRSLLPVHADAVSWVTRHVGDQTLSRVFILYPNPSKKNPAGRWLRMPFFGELLKKLKPGGEVILRTNIESYVSEAARYARNVWKLELTCLRSFKSTDVSAGEEWSHFERKYLERGETCYELVAKMAPSQGHAGAL
ncbi:MAG: SAM-dependent methyltransferase [Cryobacterium sp.]|nr:SAM-dependent methyltransferase [Oligoflexia bacterium]